MGGARKAGRNDIRLAVSTGGRTLSNFRLREFENSEGLVMLNSSVLVSLENVRRDLSLIAGEEVWVIITDAIRTDQELEELAKRLGWQDEGGLVSRDSKHHVRYGGIAVDIVGVVAATRAKVSQATVGMVCRRHFDWVKDDYADGHVHADNRDMGHGAT